MNNVRHIWEKDDDHRVDKEFGQWLQLKRRLADISRDQVAQRTGINKFRITTLETGSAKTGITRKECELIAKACGFDVDELILKASGVSR